MRPIHAREVFYAPVERIHLGAIYRERTPDSAFSAGYFLGNLHGAPGFDLAGAARRFHDACVAVGMDRDAAALRIIRGFARGVCRAIQRRGVRR